MGALGMGCTANDELAFPRKDLTFETDKLYRIANVNTPEEPNLYEKRVARFKTETKTF